MSPDRLLEYLVSDSPRWLGEASHHLRGAAWSQDTGCLVTEHLEC